jgi:acetyl-CoA carboxylase biotin carboxyl carrier protein
MKPSEIKDLIDFIDKSNLDEVNIETENFKISARKNAAKVIEQVVTQVSAPAPVAAAPVQTAVRPPEAAAPLAAPVAAPVQTGKKLLEIKSPMIGTLYRCPSPDKPNFVNVGDEIKVGQTVCIVEAMKLFNEIESDVAGRIVEIKCENASPVEFDQILFIVEPA